MFTLVLEILKWSVVLCSMVHSSLCYDHVTEVGYQIWWVMNINEVLTVSYLSNYLIKCLILGGTKTM
jgi:hypothetical protein